MKDKVQAIRNEIERLYKEWDEHPDYDRYYRGMADGLDVLEQFIDSLQDKPKTDPYGNDETEMNSLAYLEQLGYTCIPPSCERNKRDKDMTKEEAIDVLTRLANGTPAEGVFFSVREAAKVAIEALSTPELTAELEEEVIKFWNDNALAYRAGRIADLTFLRFAAQHFAKWQKGKDEKDLADKIATAYQLGLTNRQVNTGEDVVDGFIFQLEEYYPKEVIGRYDGELKHGDKVKLIIIKVDEGI